MRRSSNEFEIYLETGKKRVFAGAIDWPGWCRSGGDEAAALSALYDYGRRYAGVLRRAQLGFQAPTDASALVVVERLEGNVTTDFGAPGKPPSSDAMPVDEAELERFQELLKACWQAFDDAARAAEGKQLVKGPRGGGRELEGIIQHVLGGEAGYLTALGAKLKANASESPDEYLNRSRQVVLETLTRAAHGEVPPQGPRGGARWSPRYFVRRAAWHVLDHAWELEDRIT